MFQGGGLHLEGAIAVAPFPIGQGLLGDTAQIRRLQGLKLEQAGAADQGLVHLKVGVFGGGPNQDHRAIFHPGQQGILLGLIKAMHLVNKQNRAPALLAALLLGTGDRLAQLLHPRQHRIQGDEVGPGGVGDNLGQGGFARTRGAVENQGGELIRLDRPPQ